MPKPFLMIFSIIVAIIYSLANIYVCRKVLKAFPDNKRVKSFIIYFFIVMASSYLIARHLNNRPYGDALMINEWLGAIWMATMLYSFFISLGLDIVRIIAKKLNLIPKIIQNNYLKTKRIILIASIAIIGLTLTFGYINTRTTYYNAYDVHINKKFNNAKSYKIAFASDIHLSPTFSEKEAWRLVNDINSQNPDITILGGDIFGEYIKYDRESKLADILRNIKSKFGVFIALGNHEYIGGIDDNIDYLKQTGHRFLRDDFCTIDSSLILIGRDDYSRLRFEGAERASLPSLMANVDKSFPVILVDHQPFKLDSAKDFGADIMLSGHTHHGQLFPLNWITNSIYENSWGHLQKGNFHSFVSCGFSGWGPPFKTVGRSEILIINISGN